MTRLWHLQWDVIQILIMIVLWKMEIIKGEIFKMKTKISKVRGQQINVLQVIVRVRKVINVNLAGKKEKKRSKKNRI